jgi:hypothetical protein
MSPEEALRNKISLEWVKAHWNEIEDTSLEEADELEARKRAWVEAEMAKRMAP